MRRFLENAKKNGKGLVFAVRELELSANTQSVCLSLVLSKNKSRSDDRNVFYASPFSLSTFKAPYFFAAKFVKRGEQLDFYQVP